MKKTPSTVALENTAVVEEVIEDEEIKNNNIGSSHQNGTSTETTPGSTTISFISSPPMATIPQLAPHSPKVLLYEPKAEEPLPQLNFDSIQAPNKNVTISDIFHNTKVAFGEDRLDEEEMNVCELIHEALVTRKKYVESYYPWERPSAPEGYGAAHEVPTSPRCPYDPFDVHFHADVKVTNEKFKFHEGILNVYDENEEKVLFKDRISYKEHYNDMKKLNFVIQTPAVKTYCYKRLQFLELKFQLYKALHEKEEAKETKAVSHRDFYNVRKVDTHVHLASAMNQKHLLRFIKYKLKTASNEVVIFRDGKKLTLSEVFKSLNLTSYDLSVDTLDVHADKSTHHRFDKFNLKYNPFGQSRLREIFLKTDNLIQGRYFAEMIKELMKDLEDSKYQLAEYRVSIYGRSKDEWDKLAKWIVNHRLYSQNVRWLIQIPRLYNVHKETNFLKGNFEEFLSNIFTPLFEVSRDSSSHPELHAFLKQVVGFDSVDDESKPEPRFHSKLPMPDIWNTTDNPPFCYYNYFFFTNLDILNRYRSSKHLNTFRFRPHSGEAGDVSHLLSSFFLAEGSAHGIELRRTPALQYLYYLTQIPLYISPLSNNHLFLNYSRNPFFPFFCRGLNVSLSTDDPLQFHLSREPLIEEYSIAGQVWHFTNTDLCEVARNSVLHSGWESIYKRYWLGENYYLPGVHGNNIDKTNVPNIRCSYRHETLMDEHLLILKNVVLSKNYTKYANTLPLTLSQLLLIINRDKPDFEKTFVMNTFTSGKNVEDEEKILLPPNTNLSIRLDVGTNTRGVDSHTQSTMAPDSRRSSVAIETTSFETPAAVPTTSPLQWFVKYGGWISFTALLVSTSVYFLRKK